MGFEHHGQHVRAPSRVALAQQAGELSVRLCEARPQPQRACHRDVAPPHGLIEDRLGRVEVALDRRHSPLEDRDVTGGRALEAAEPRRGAG